MNIAPRTDTLQMSPSVYFSPTYGMADGRHRGYEWTNIAADDGRWQLPLHIRRDQHGFVDATTPYGYGGIWFDASLDRSDLTKAWAQSIEALRQMGVVSMFLRFSPFLPCATDRLVELTPGLIVKRVSETVLVDVTDIDTTWSTMQGRARTAIRKARGRGLHSRVSFADAEKLSSGSPFRTLYEATMNRLGAAEQYLFDDTYYISLMSGLAEELQIVEVLDSTGQTVASALLLCDTQGIVHYHLSGSDPAAAREGANNLLIWTILEWSSERGFTSVHLGGGVTAGDSLFKFKTSFGGERLPFNVGGVIIDADAYESAVADRARVLGHSPESLKISGFFPAYRAGAR